MSDEQTTTETPAPSVVAPIATVDMPGVREETQKSERPSRDAWPDSERPVDADSSSPPPYRMDIRQAETPQDEPSVEERLQTKPPKSWSLEDQRDFMALPQDAQIRIAEREAKREADISRKLQEAADARRRAEAQAAAIEQERQGRITAEEQAYRTARTVAEQQAEQYRQSMFDALVLANPALEAFRNADPARLDQFMQDNPQLAPVIMRAGQALQQFREQKTAQALQQIAAFQQAEQNRAAQWHAWSSAADAEFQRRNPGFEQHHQDTAMDYLKSLGLSDQQIGEAYSQPLLRSVQGQETLFAASQWWAAQQRIRNGEGRAAPPKPQSPGTSSGYGGSRDPLSDAANRGDMASFFAMRNNSKRRH